jgi:hypothetical protein
MHGPAAARSETDGRYEAGEQKLPHEPFPPHHRSRARRENPGWQISQKCPKDHDHDDPDNGCHKHLKMT